MARLTEGRGPKSPLPTVVSGRCVHSLLQRASCRACVEVCPRGAWTLDEERLALDEAACDACGLCRAACPQGALGVAFAPRTWALAEGPLGLAACERAAAGLEGEGVLPCLHGLGLGGLLAAYRAGVRMLALSHGDCEGCDRGGRRSLFELLDRLNGLLRDRGLGGLRAQRPPPADWQRLRARAAERETGPPLSRRQFLRSALAQAAQPLAPPAHDAPFLAPGQYLPSQPGDPLVQAPILDPARCNGCGDCTRICPQGVLVLRTAADRGSGSLCVEPDRCSGCGLCRDLCAQEAVRIEQWSILSDRELPLGRRRCRSCGVPFFHAQEDVETRCQVCRRRGPANPLYQVLD